MFDRLETSEIISPQKSDTLNANCSKQSDKNKLCSDKNSDKNCNSLKEAGKGNIDYNPSPAVPILNAVSLATSTFGNPDDKQVLATSPRHFFYYWSFLFKIDQFCCSTSLMNHSRTRQLCNKPSRYYKYRKTTQFGTLNLTWNTPKASQ